MIPAGSLKDKIFNGAKNAGLVLGALLFALGFAEFLFRLFVPAEALPPPQKVLVHEASDNLKLLYKPSPNMQNQAYGVLNQINSEGFRDKEYPRDKPEGVKRIIFLGDSVVYGYGLLAEDTLPKKLEELYRERGPRAEVLNLGVSGYDTEQEVEFFEEVGLKFHPDQVLVGYTLNDSIFASMELNLFRNRVDRHVQVERKEWRKRFFGFLFGHSRLFAYLDKRLQLQARFRIFRSYREQSIWHYLEDRSKIIRDPEESPYQQLRASILAEADQRGTSPQGREKMLSFIGIGNEALYSSHWNVSRKAFERLQALSREHGFKVTVVLFPYGIEPGHYALGPVHNFLAGECRGLGFNVIDLLPLVEDPAAGPLFSDSIHFDAGGSGRAAAMLYAGLEN